MTNFEKIKSMTIEEMAELFEIIQDDEREDWRPIGCLHCVNYGTHHYPKDCSDCEWLGGIEQWLGREESLNE